MAAATNSASVTSHHHSPRSSGDPAALNSLSRRAAARGSSPWNQAVRGGELDSVAPSSPSSTARREQVAHISPDSAAPSGVADASGSSPENLAAEGQADSSDWSGGNNNASKKPAWSKPSNGAVEVGPVMGADSWPALSESTRASPKSPLSEPLKANSDGSVAVSQGTGIAPPLPQKQNITNNSNPSSTPNHGAPTRQKSMRRGGGSSSGGASSNGGFPQAPPPLLSPLVESPSNNAVRSGSIVQESSPRDTGHKETGQRGGSQSHGGNDHVQQHNSSRRGNGGPHPRGDGSFHRNYGARHDQDRGNHDLNSHNRSFNGREAHMHPQRVPRAFIRPTPPSNIPYIPPPPVPLRPYVNPMVYPEVAPPMLYVPGPPPESLRGLPIVAPHAMFYPVPDRQLHSKIVNQIDYYFSDENLIKDTFLRQNMDDQGWVPVKLIAGFRKVMQLTDNIQFILNAVSASAIVEVQGDRIRRRNDWSKWIMSVSSPPSFGRSNYDVVAANFQNVSLEEKAEHGRTGALLSISSSADLSDQPQQYSGEGTSQSNVQPGSEHLVLARSSSK